MLAPAWTWLAVSLQTMSVIIVATEYSPLDALTWYRGLSPSSIPSAKWSPVQIWRHNQKSGDWQQDGATLVGHTDWVRDVAWAPNLGLPKSIIASAGQDGKVLIWTESREVPGQWSPALLHDFKVRAHPLSLIAALK